MQDLMERADTATARRTPSTERRADTTKAQDSQAMVSKAVMGAAAGALGVWALDRADWFMWDNESNESRLKTTAVRPGGEPPAHAAVSKIEQMFGLDPTPRQHDLAGDTTHYSLGIGPAILYAMFRDKLPVKGPARGALYGLGLFVAQDEVLNSASGLAAQPQDYPWQAHARGLVAHLVYGVATEVALNLMEKAVKPRSPEAAS